MINIVCMCFWSCDFMLGAHKNAGSSLSLFVFCEGVVTPLCMYAWYVES